MAKQEYFQSALADFAFDMASGGAIRHLADQGYTVEEIRKRLDFPTPPERVAQTMRKHFEETGVLLYGKPGQDGQERYAWVTEYDRYGKKTFRRMSLAEDNAFPAIQKERSYRKEIDGNLQDLLAARCAQNGEETAYASCDFGLLRMRAPGQFDRALACLPKRHRDYILEIFTQRKAAWHRLDRRMREIVAALYENGEYHGACCFCKLGEKLTIT